MELEWKKNALDAFAIGAEQVITQEETAETIVPDYCPDIARIIDGEGRVFLHRREVSGGRAEVSGVVRVTLLYVPEGEGGIRSLVFSLPFRAQAEGMGDAVCLLTEAELESLENRLTNPRKVFTRCRLTVRLRPCRPLRRRRRPGWKNGRRSRRPVFSPPWPRRISPSRTPGPFPRGRRGRRRSCASAVRR